MSGKLRVRENALSGGNPRPVECRVPKRAGAGASPRPYDGRIAFGVLTGYRTFDTLRTGPTGSRFERKIRIVSFASPAYLRVWR
jgi:hypothetical protein